MCRSLEETPLRELEPAEKEIKAAMLTKVPEYVLEKLTELMRGLFEKANAPWEVTAAAPAGTQYFEGALKLRDVVVQRMKRRHLRSQRRSKSK